MTEHKLVRFPKPNIPFSDVYCICTYCKNNSNFSSDFYRGRYRMYDKPGRTEEEREEELERLSNLYADDFENLVKKSRAGALQLRLVCYLMQSRIAGRAIESLKTTGV